jgi:hypothetical protein
MLMRLLTGRAATPQDKRIQDGTALRRLPSLKACWRPGEHHPAHRVRNLGPGKERPSQWDSDQASNPGYPKANTTTRDGRIKEGQKCGRG